MAKFSNITEIVSDLMENDFEEAAVLIKDLVETAVNADENSEDIETVLSLTLPTLKAMVGDDSEDGDDLLGAI